MTEQKDKHIKLFGHIKEYPISDKDKIKYNNLKYKIRYYDTIISDLEYCSIENKGFKEFFEDEEFRNNLNEQLENKFDMKKYEKICLSDLPHDGSNLKYKDDIQKIAYLLDVYSFMVFKLQSRFLEYIR